FGIKYAAVAVVSHGYRRDQIGSGLRGFGVLISRTERGRTLGTVWNSSLFAGRAPEGHVLLTSFIGGASDGKALSLSWDELSVIVHHDVSRILGIRGEPM